MNLETLHKSYNNLRTDDQCLSYQGRFSNNIIGKIIRLNELTLKEDSFLFSEKKNMSVMMIECFQNVLIHSRNSKKYSGTSVKSDEVFTRRNDNGFYIASANLISNKDIDKLQSSLDKLIRLDTEALSDLYKSTLSNSESYRMDGAGLGFIELARLSHNNIEYSIKGINDSLSFLHFGASIKTDSLHSKSREEDGNSLSLSNNIQEFLNAEKVFFLYKGEFREQSILAILNMIEENLNHREHDYKYKKRIYAVLVELLQNISLHAFETNGTREGIFLMGREESGYVLGSGNIIDNQHVDSLKMHLDQLKELDEDELSELYKIILAKEDNECDSKGSAGLGLIDIARESDNRMTYNVEPFDKETSLFTNLVRM